MVPGEEVTIRPYHPATDFAGLRACFVALQDHEHAMIPAAPTGAAIVDEYIPWMLGRCRDHAGAVFVAVDGSQIDESQIVGFVSVLAHVPRREPDDSDPAHGFVGELSVVDGHRGRGIGQALLEAAERHAASHGASNLRIAIVADNDGARRLYERAGYRPMILTLRKALGRSPGG